MPSISQLQNGNLVLAVDASTGARITQFSLKGRNALYEGRPEWGSTFWPSPQHAWGWPPPPTLDCRPYHNNGDTIRLSFCSDSCPITGLALHKDIVAVADGFDVTYRMVNTTARAVTFAPWEITRVAGGITFFTGSDLPLSNSSLALTACQYGQQHSLWHQYQVENQSDNLKAFANNSSGWLANAHNGLLLLKRFPQIPLALIAPQEAEVEIYAHGDVQEAYIEIEQQGAYSLLPPGDDLAWTVRWSLYEIPQYIKVEIGSESLLKWVETLL